MENEKYPINKKAEKQWNSSRIALKNYQNYAKDKDCVTLVDLLYISNFKGGNATINEEENIINSKLSAYSYKINNFKRSFKNKELKTLTGDDRAYLEKFITEMCSLVMSPETKINGFGISYLSALLHAHFPNLIPIADRRVLFNMKIIKEWQPGAIREYDTQYQIINIDRHYLELINETANILASDVMASTINCAEPCRISLKDIDKHYFIQKTFFEINRELGKKTKAQIEDQMHY